MKAVILAGGRGTRLEQVTGVPAPKPLAGLADREVRFTDCVEKQEMLAAVDGFLC